MSDALPSVTIRLDPLNPAQFFACCGLLELLSARNKNTLACFGHNPQQSRRASFTLHSIDASQLSAAMSALKEAKITASADFAGGEAPVQITIRDVGTIVLDWWLSLERDEKSDLKLWAGNQTTQKLVQDMLTAEWGGDMTAAFEYRLPMSGRFGLDPRSAWNTLDFGCSLNEEVKRRDGKNAYTYPATEMLAAIGLQGFRPSQQTRKGFLYSLWSSPLPLVVARAAAAGALPTTANYEFEFEVAKRSGSYSYFTFAEPRRNRL